MRYLDINCNTCGNSFKIQPKRYNYSRKHGRIVYCCSKECRRIYKYNKNKEIIKCSICHNNFIRQKNLKRKRKFCSQVCANKYASSLTNPLNISLAMKRFNASEIGKACRAKISERARKYKLCPKCNNKFYGTKKYCSKRCLIESSGDIANKISIKRKSMFQDGDLEITGGNTKWLTYKDIRVQGSYEYRTCIILDRLKVLNLIKNWHKSNFRIKYVGHDNNEHTYLVDFEIITNTGKILYLEIKGYIRPNDLLKWKAMRFQSYKLIVWMDNHLKQIEKKLKI